MGNPFLAFTSPKEHVIPQADVARAFAALKGKQALYEQRWAYYEGNHPLVYATAKLQRVFKKLDARWNENWCSVVVDSLTDRIQLTGFHYVGEDAPKDPKAPPHPVQVALDDWWDAQDVAGDSEEITQAVAVCSEGFYIAEQADDKTIRSIANAPHLCAVLYREDDPKTPEFAAKWWDEDGVAHLTLYYANTIEHYVATKQRAQVTEAAAFTPAEVPEETNTFGQIPLFHFRKNRRGSCRLTNVIPLNNALNKLFADMMVAAEFGAFKQRAIISKADVTEAAKAMKTGASEVAMIPGNAEAEGQNTEIKEFSETPLKNYIDALDHIASRIAILTHTPKHYLLQTGDVSGEALIAMEAPLNKDAASYMRRLSVTWKQCAAFVMKLSGIPVSPDDIEPVWEEEATVQPYTEALIIQALAKSGLPLATIMRMVKGWSDEEVAEMLADADADEARTASMGQAALQEAQRRFDGGEGAMPYPEPSEGEAA